VTSWGAFRRTEPELAAFAEQRLGNPPAYLATIRANGTPRVHPITPIVTSEDLYVFMEPTSPKGADLRERGWYAMHNRVDDTAGTGGELIVSGRGRMIEDIDVRTLVTELAPYQPAERYVLFELSVSEVRCHGYGDTPLPRRRRWKAGPDEEVR
jgi:hypothetical protein